MDAEGAAGESPPVEEDVEPDDGKPEGDEDEDVIPETVEDHSDQGGNDSGQNHSHRQGGEKRPVEGGDGLGAQQLVIGGGGEDGDGIGPDSEETDVADREQAGEPHHED